jgi:hypothetical protein
MKMPICATAGVASGGAATVAGVRINASVSALRPKIPLILPQPNLAQPMTPSPGLVLFDQNNLLKQNRSYRNSFRKTRLDDAVETMAPGCVWICNESIRAGKSTISP